MFRNAISARAAQRRMIDERPSIKVRDDSRTVVNPYQCRCSDCRDWKFGSRIKKDAHLAEIRDGIEAYFTTDEPVVKLDVAVVDSVRSSWKAAEKWIIGVFPPAEYELEDAPPAA